MSSMGLNETTEQNETSSANSDFQGWNLNSYIVPSVLITVFGTVTNLLSLSYFITQRHLNNRKSRTEIINNHLFIVLNVFDILVCIFLSALLLSFRYDIDEGDVQETLLLLFVLAVQTTGFITCLLSVIRAISIIRPTHHLNIKAIAGTTILYSGIMIYLNIQYNARNVKATMIHFTIYTALFIAVVLCNVVCMVKLALSKVASWKREATITMGIFSAVYCIFNIGFLVFYGFHVFVCGIQETVCLSVTFEAISMYILLPMNSASNPVVYFLRNREMRRYLKNVWRKMTCRRSEQEVRPEQDMTISNIARDRTEVTEDRYDAD